MSTATNVCLFIHIVLIKLLFPHPIWNPLLVKYRQTTLDI